MFTIQTKDHNGKWKPLRFGGPPHSNIETAISVARRLDQDGLFPSTVRIVDSAGNVVMKGGKNIGPGKLIDGMT